MVTPERKLGLPLYMASSAFIRRTMKTLYSDLRVELRKFAIQSPSTSTQINPAAVTHTYLKREKTLFISLSVYGTTRVSGGLGEWQMCVHPLQKVSLISVLDLTCCVLAEIQHTHFRLSVG
jgi:hypothetical protein